MIKVGFIGLGRMGTPMVLNLLRRGFEVEVYSAHLDSENVSIAVRQGATVAGTPKILAARSSVVMLSLPGAEVSEAVVRGSDGVLEGARPGTIIVEMSTVPPSTIRKMAEAAKVKNVEMLDAPVSGGRVGAEKGTLTIMVGGEKGVFERCLPAFKAMGKNIFHVGELGAGETIKLINTLLADTNLLTARECLELASGAGVDPSLLQQIVATSTGQSWMWDNWVPSLLEKKTVGATFDMVLKDFNYGTAMATAVGTDPKIVKTALAVLDEWRRAKGGAADISSAFAFRRRPVGGSRRRKT